MRYLIPFAFFSTTSAIVCPYGWIDDGSGSCYSIQGTTKQNQLFSRRLCSYFDAYMYDIKNAFDNSKVQETWLKTPFGRYGSVWLGLTCLSNATTSCLWDSGRVLKEGDYNNFQNGAPNIENGPCVAMDVVTGLWFSLPCTSNSGYTGCQYTPGIHVNDCIENGSTDNYFRGYCYSSYDGTQFGVSPNEAEKRCVSQNSHSPSIHSQGENYFVRDLTNSGDNLYLGLRRKGDSFSWTDGSPYDYTNFDNSSFPWTPNGECGVMPLGNIYMGQRKGAWSVVDCDAEITYMHSGCKWKFESRSYTSYDCSETIYLNGTGLVSSPDYPNSSPHAICEYVITQSVGTRAKLIFDKSLLSGDGTVTCYDGLESSSTPIQTFFCNPSQSKKLLRQANLAGGGGCVASGNILRLVFSTTGNFVNFIAGEYGSIPLNG